MKTGWVIEYVSWWHSTKLVSSKLLIFKGTQEILPGSLCSGVGSGNETTFSQSEQHIPQRGKPFN